LTGTRPGFKALEARTDRQHEIPVDSGSGKSDNPESIVASSVNPKPKFIFYLDSNPPTFAPCFFLINVVSGDPDALDHQMYDVDPQLHRFHYLSTNHMPIINRDHQRLTNEEPSRIVNCSNRSISSRNLSRRIIYSSNPAGFHRDPLKYFGSIYEGKSTAALTMSSTSFSSNGLGCRLRVEVLSQSDTAIVFKCGHEWAKLRTSCFVMYVPCWRIMQIESF
jgi:hypothetical protein